MKILQLTNRLEEFIEEAALRLAVISSRGSFFRMQYLEQPFVCGDPNGKESKWQSLSLMLLCEGLCESLVPLQRQHFTASNDLHEHPRGHSPWRESTRTKFMNIQMGYSKVRSEPSEYMWKTRVVMIHLENYFGNYAQEVLGEKLNES